MGRIFKIILWVVTLFVAFCILIAAILPPLLSTSFGNKKAIEWFNTFSNGHLSIGEFQISWLGKQHIKDLEFHNKKGDKIVSLDLLDSATPLLNLIFGTGRIGATNLETPYLLIDQGDKREVSSIPPKRKKHKNRIKKWLHFSKELTIREGTIIFKSPHSTPITLSDIQVENQPNQGIFSISAKSKKGDLDGKLEARVIYGDILTAKGVITNLPVALFDQFCNSPFYSDTIGESLDLTFSSVKESDGLVALNANITAKNLNGKLIGEIKENKIFLSPSSSLTAIITPKLFNHLLPESQKKEWSLANNTEFSIAIEKGVFPLNLTRSDFQEVVLKAHGVINRAEINHKTLGAYSLNKFNFEVISSDNIVISYKGEIQGKEPSILNGEISITPQGDLYYKTDFKGFPVSLVSLISPSVESNVRQLFGQFFDLKAEGTYRDDLLHAEFELSTLNLTTSGTVIGTFEQLDFDIKGTKKITGNKAAYLGATANFHLNGIAELSDESASIPLINGKITTPNFLVDLRGTIGERGKKLDLNEVELVATCEVVALPFTEDVPQVFLKNGSFSLNIDGPSNKISGQGFINTRMKTSEGMVDSKALQTRFEITNYIEEGALHLEKANIFFISDSDRLPLVLLNPLIQNKIDISALFGQTAKIHARGSYTPTQEPRGMLDFQAKGDGLEVSFSVAVDGTLSVAHNKPAYLHWELTPQRFRTLMSGLKPEIPPLYNLTHSSAVDIFIGELTCPTNLPKDISHFLCQSGFVGDISIGPLSFQKSGSQEYLVIKETKGSIRGKNFSESIDLSLAGQVFAHNIPETEHSSFEFKGTMLNFWNPEGHFNREGLTFDGDLSLDLLPVKQMTEIYPMETESRQLLQALLGELVNAKIYGKISQLTGPLTIDIKASNFKAILPLMLYPQSIQLRDAVNAEITVTEAVNLTLIKDLNPLFIAGVYSEHPLKLYLDPQGFVIPIRPFFLQGVNIERAICDIGKIRVRNGGQIQRLMDFLKIPSVTHEGDMDAWFTPIYFSLKNGVVSHNRFDALLAGSVHIALWGAVNLINNEVQMTLGIAASSLQHRLNVKGLSDTEMFQVKMRGTTDNLDLDWSSATTRIGILIAKTSGGLGQLLGGILEHFVAPSGEVTPPPTTSPFPWQRS